MKQNAPPEPVIAYDHTGTEHETKDPTYRLVGRILLIIEVSLIIALTFAMINLY